MYVQAIVAVIAFQVGVLDAQTCNDERDCIGTTVVDMECNGYRSCERSINEGVLVDVECDGGYSCYNAVQIVSLKHEIFCGGENSCTNVSLMQTSNDIDCNGMLSCVNSTLVSFANESDYARCYGDQSCTNAIFHGFEKVFSGGAYSLHNAIVYSSNVTQLEGQHHNLWVRFDGYFAGMFAFLTCLQVFGISLHKASFFCLLTSIYPSRNCLYSK